MTETRADVLDREAPNARRTGENAAHGWIDAEVRQPPDASPVRVHLAVEADRGAATIRFSVVTIATFGPREGGGRGWSRDHGRITHWMPLPIAEVSRHDPIPPG